MANLVRVSRSVLVDFHGDTLTAILGENGKVYVPFREPCENLGVSFAAQTVKLKKARWARVAIIEMRDTKGRMQKQLCLELDCLPMWLATINEGKVAGPIREKLIRYQCDARDVLAAHFLGTAKTEPARPTLAPYQRRVLHAGRIRHTVPAGHFTIFEECSSLLIQVEAAFLVAGLPLDEHDLFDASVGMKWAAHRSGQPWALPFDWYIHVFPPGDVRRERACKCYRTEELHYFRQFMECCYKPVFLAEYVARKWGKPQMLLTVPVLRDHGIPVARQLGER